MSDWTAWAQAGGATGLLLAFAKLVQVWWGSADNRLRQQLDKVRLDNERDQQEHTQKLDVTQVLAEQLDKKEKQLEQRDLRIEKLRVEIHTIGDRCTQLTIQEALNTEKISQLERRAITCEKDREALNERVRLLEKKMINKEKA